MKAFSLRTAMLVAGLALAAGPALAQKAGPAGGGSNGGGGGGVNAGSGGTTAGGGSVVGTASSGSTASSSSSASGGFSSAPSAGGFGPSASSSFRGEPMRTAAPEHRTSFSYSSNTASQRQRSAPASSSSSSSSSSSGRQATPRASSGSSGGQRAGNSRRADNPNANAGARPRADQSHAAAARSAEAAANNPAGNGEVPSWSRNRGGRPATGTAVPRSPDNPIGGRFAGGYYGRYGYFDPYYYDPMGIYGFYGFGGGYYGFYNPYYSPYGFGGYGLDPGFGYPYYGDPTDPYMYGEGYGSYSSRVYSGQGEGALKLKVKPRNAKVYVDGYFVGNVDQFDGMFKKLTLNGGAHKVEVKADGYETEEFDVLITPGQTLTFAGELKKLQ